MLSIFHASLSFHGFFDSKCVQIISSSVCISSPFFYSPCDEKKEENGERFIALDFEKKKKRNRYRYRGIARVWLDIQHVSSRWDRSLMHSREEWDGNPFTTRNRYANSWGKKKRKKKKFLLSSPFFVG